jgi:hypothetical protein
VAGAIIFVGILGRDSEDAGRLRRRGHNVRTISTAWGHARHIFFFIILGITAIVMLAPTCSRLPPIYAYIVALGVFPVAYYVMVRVHRERTGPQLEQQASCSIRLPHLVCCRAAWGGGVRSSRKAQRKDLTQDRQDAKYAKRIFFFAYFALLAIFA